MDNCLSLLFLLCVVAAVMLYYIPVGLWMEAVFANVPMNPLHLLVMRLRRLDPADVVRPLIMGRQAGLTDIDADKLEGHLLAGGNVHRLVRALIEADKAKIPLDFLEATNLVGPESYVKERIEAFRESGVTNLQIMPAADDPAALVTKIKELINA